MAILRTTAADPALRAELALAVVTGELVVTHFGTVARPKTWPPPSTAFLAAGARTVFASLWRVPDSATSLLMYMVHHYLNAEECQPAEALHRAQLWMVDPDRRPPDGMPDALVPYCSRPDAADPVSWAGFVHAGG